MKLMAGDILESTCDAIVIPVNLKSVMGGGLALQAKQAHPEIFKSYARWCCIPGVIPGDGIGIDVYKGDGTKQMYLCLSTKNHWRYDSQLEWIERGVLISIPKIMEQAKIKSIAVPKIGCGYGHLKWEDVRKILEKAAESFPEIDWYIYE